MASVNTQFSIAVHMLAGLAHHDKSVTSEGLARSVNANPIFVKRILSKLAKAKLIHTTKGKTGGCTLAKNPKNISLFDVYSAVDAPSAFAIHAYPSVRSCIISSNIKDVMGEVLEGTQKALEKDLKQTTLADVVTRIRSN